uniref:Uncharacterized protein n=1 Tax=Asparagus officinalis TaxID=4686 RepID=Q2XNT2_ASPOF|nr:hypothetical protein 12.t00002 [Asparagus officinalis]ABB55340.1 hypothetical protein 9.t00001 [Asparagus officinalis]
MVAANAAKFTAQLANLGEVTEAGTFVLPSFEPPEADEETAQLPLLELAPRLGKELAEVSTNAKVESAQLSAAEESAMAKATLASGGSSEWHFLHCIKELKPHAWGGLWEMLISTSKGRPLV